MKRSLLVGMLVVASLGLFCDTSNADNITVISPGTISLNSGDSVTFNSISPIDPGAKRVKLCFKMRANMPGSNGFSYGINFYLNGTKLIGADSRYKVRLRNKPVMGVANTIWNGYVSDWNSYCRPLSGWVMIIYSSYGTGSAAWLQDPQWSNYELAVEDLVYSDQPNTLRIDNDHGNINMVFTDITIGTYDAEDGFGDITEVPAIPNRGIRRSPTSYPKPTAVVNGSNGGLDVYLGATNYRIESLFSYPNGGFNVIGPGPTPELSEPGFDGSISVTTIDPHTTRVTAAGAYYSLDRLITRLDNAKIQIKDNITNTSGADLPLIVQHYIKFDGRIIQHVFMGGDPDAGRNNINVRGHPSLYASLPQGGVALMAEDKFFRYQVQCFYDSIDVDGTGIKTEHLTIPAGQSYCMEWSVYAYQDAAGYGDYFDFVNLIRNEWGTNFTVNGPYAFDTSSSLLDSSSSALASACSAINNNTYAISIGSSFWYDPIDESLSWLRHFLWNGGTPEADAWMADMEAVIPKLRAAIPQVKLVHKIETLLNGLRPIGDLGDSQVRNYLNQMVHYPGTGSDNYLVYPTLTNIFGQALGEQIDYIMDNHSLDGLFIDEFTGSGPADHALVPFCTFYRQGTPLWDNHTAAIHLGTKTILKKAACENVLFDAWYKQRLGQLKSRDAVLLTAGMPVSKDYSDMDIPSMVETQSNMARGYETNLYSPLAYTSWYEIDQVIDRLEMGSIPFRVSATSVHRYMGKMFPLTPIELHKGWILAHERLITSRTGYYAWDYSVTGTLYRYGSDGNLVDQAYRNIPYIGGLIVVPLNGLSIFVRDDLPKTCFEAQQIGYGMQTDLNNDCYVDWGDFSIFASHWLDQGCGLDADFDGSCLVDWGDFSIFAGTWLDCNDPENIPPCIANW